MCEAITTDTAAVMVPTVHWYDGITFDLPRVAEAARAAGAALIVDGTQSVGALPFDCAIVQPDALVCAGYKWLLGPVWAERRVPRRTLCQWSATRGHVDRPGRE